jgi:hypothetical protein
MHSPPDVTGVDLAGYVPEMTLSHRPEAPLNPANGAVGVSARFAATGLVSRALREASLWLLLIALRRLFEFGADAMELHHLPLQSVEEKIDHRRGEEREGLRNEQSAEDGNAKGLAKF